MPARTALLVLLVPGVLAACNVAEDPDQTPRPALADTTPSVEGVVRVTGAQPVSTEVEIRSEDATYRVDGPLRDEILGLSGVTIRALGPVEAGRVRVERYEVVSVDGRPAVSGTVSRQGGEVWLETDDGRRIRLRGAPDDFRNGDRVWVQGEPRVELDVGAFGRIRSQR